MVYVPVQCPHCQSTKVIKTGNQSHGAQRYQCQNLSHYSPGWFILERWKLHEHVF
jgi:hypothetical protein